MVSFPLGGIGTGTIGLGGRGELRDWEIYNNPNLGYRPPYTMAYIFAKQGGRKIARVLERQLLPPHHASGGLPPAEFPGLPRLKEAIFVGTYPFARVAFQDKDLPVEVVLEAFNPMIPMNPEDSAIPAAVLTYRLTNRGRQRVSGSVAMSVANTVGLSGAGLGGNVNAWREEGGVRGIEMTATRYAPGQIGYGSMALMTSAEGVTYATDFDEPGWFDRGQKAWDDFSADGRMDGPTAPAGPSQNDRTCIGMIAAPFDLAPGQSGDVQFIIAWSFPLRPITFHLPPGSIEMNPSGLPVQNHYARRFGQAWQAGQYLAENFGRLREQTVIFERAIFDSTLPGDVLDAASSQMAIMRTNTTLWVDTPADEPLGRIFAFEGCNPKSGCCPLNCTHVWNYEQSLAHLYPQLERTMRLTDFEDNLHDEGAMSFRSTIPLKVNLPVWEPKLPAADGQFGTVVKAYREWRLSGDDQFLRRLWPGVRQSIRFAWEGFAKWDADKDGVLEGMQHNTYDIEFHGPNTMCGSLYLAALAAGAEMAKAVGDQAAAVEFAAVLESGRRKTDRLLFNGRYYQQQVTDLKEDFVTPFGNLLKAGRPKYQYGYGCLADQLLGQWAAHVAGLGYVLPREHVGKAMASIFRHNFKNDLSDHECCQRVYALNDEAGLLACTWPLGKREKFPFPYSDEIWTGIEYQVAAGLIYEGLVGEGLSVVSAIRARHDGLARNPWNEFECGDHYARAMASWSVLLALAGQRYDGRTKTLTMQPRIAQRDFACIFTAARGYGFFRQRLGRYGMHVEIYCLGGEVELAGVELLPAKLPGKNHLAHVEPAGQQQAVDVRSSAQATLVRLPMPVTLNERQVLTLGIGQK
jgi:uncharacterized protein (DUF608 family)